jgi:hypothetical protein
MIADCRWLYNERFDLVSDMKPHERRAVERPAARPTCPYPNQPLGLILAKTAFRLASHAAPHGLAAPANNLMPNRSIAGLLSKNVFCDNLRYCPF